MNDSPPRSRSRLPFDLRIETWLIALASLLVVAAMVVVAGALITHRLKEHLLREAEEEMRREMDHARQSIGEAIAAERDRTLREAAETPEVRTQMSLLVRQGGMVRMAAILTPDGQVLVRRFQEGGANDHVLEGDEAAVGRLESDTTFEVRRESAAGGLKKAIQKVAPIGDESAPAGFLALEAVNPLESEEVRRLSREINRSLAWTVGLLLAALALAFTILYKIFSRHLALERERETQAHLATIGSLASGLAHEIRNPLQIIRTNLELVREDLEERAATPAAAASLGVLDHLEKQITHLNTILREFMEYAIPGKMEFEEIDLRTLLGGTVEFTQPEFQRRGIEVELRVPPEARARGDATALNQVFLNILLNAAQAMDSVPTAAGEGAGAQALSAGAPRRVSIEAERDRPGFWRIRFADTGPGLPPGKEEEIFRAMVSFRPGGTGFGLAIARRILEQHGGRIWAQNRRDAPRGAEFLLLLPAAD